LLTPTSEQIVAQDAPCARSNRKYAGWNVWAVWTQKLRTRYRRNPQDQWVMKEGAFKSVADQPTFNRAQRVIASKTYRMSSDALLRDVKRLLKRHGGVISEVGSGANSP
jgi:hypothetical protein